jgi:hypothetical protein
MSIVDTGRFWEILVIPVLQILEDSGKYWSIAPAASYYPTSLHRTIEVTHLSRSDLCM